MQWRAVSDAILTTSDIRRIELRFLVGAAQNGVAGVMMCKLGEHEGLDISIAVPGESALTLLATQP